MKGCFQRWNQVKKYIYVMKVRYWLHAGLKCHHSWVVISREGEGKDVGEESALVKVSLLPPVPDTNDLTHIP